MDEIKSSREESTEQTDSTQYISHKEVRQEEGTFIPSGFEGPSNDSPNSEPVGRGEEEIYRRWWNSKPNEKSISNNSPIGCIGRSDVRAEAEKQSGGTPSSDTSIDTNGTKCSSCKKREKLRRKYSSFTSNAGVKTPCELASPPRPETGQPLLAPVYSFGASGWNVGNDALGHSQHCPSFSGAVRQSEVLPCVQSGALRVPRADSSACPQVPNRELVLAQVPVYGNSGYAGAVVPRTNYSALTPAYLPTLGFRTGFKLAMAVGKYWWKNKFR